MGANYNTFNEILLECYKCCIKNAEETKCVPIKDESKCANPKFTIKESAREHLAKVEDFMLGMKDTEKMKKL